MILKDLRLRCGITQPAAAKLVGIPFRTYCRYEADEAYKDSFKYAQIVKILEDYLKDRFCPWMKSEPPFLPRAAITR